MKKLVLTAAVVACASMVMAQTTQSQNIVGYTKVTASGSQLALVALNLITADDVQTMIGDQVPNGTKLHIWRKGSGYETIAKAGRGAGQFPGGVLLGNGEAFWIELPGGTPATDIILPGEVLTTSNSVTIAGPIDATGYYYPVGTTWGATDLSAQLPNGAKLHLWTGSNYTTHAKAGRGAGQWSAAAQAEVIDPARGFWVEAPATSWNEDVPFTP